MIKDNIRKEMTKNYDKLSIFHPVYPFILFTSLNQETLLDKIENQRKN